MPRDGLRAAARRPAGDGRALPYAASGAAAALADAAAARRPPPPAASPRRRSLALCSPSRPSVRCHRTARSRRATCGTRWRARRLALPGRVDFRWRRAARGARPARRRESEEEAAHLAPMVAVAAGRGLWAAVGATGDAFLCVFPCALARVDGGGGGGFVGAGWATCRSFSSTRRATAAAAADSVAAAGGRRRGGGGAPGWAALVRLEGALVGERVADPPPGAAVSPWARRRAVGGVPRRCDGEWRRRRWRAARGGSRCV